MYLKDDFYRFYFPLENFYILVVRKESKFLVNHLLKICCYQPVPYILFDVVTEERKSCERKKTICWDFASLVVIVHSLPLTHTHTNTHPSSPSRRKVEKQWGGLLWILTLENQLIPPFIPRAYKSIKCMFFSTDKPIEKSSDRQENLCSRESGDASYHFSGFC